MSKTTSEPNSHYSHNCELLTVAQLATRLQVRPGWVYDHADILGVLRLGKYLRFLWPQVLENLQQRKIQLVLQTNDLN
jgi:hypothetical protein